MITNHMRGLSRRGDDVACYLVEVDSSVVQLNLDLSEGALCAGINRVGQPMTDAVYLLDCLVYLPQAWHAVHTVV